MNMKKLLFLTALCFFFTSFLFSQKVSKEDALKVGLNFYEHTVRKAGLTKSSFNVENHIAFIDKSGDEAIHAFSFGDDGFVLVSAEMASTPILAYSYESGFNYLQEMAPATKAWLNSYVEQIEQIRAKNIKPTEKELQLWKSHYANDFSIEKNTIFDREVPKLLSTTWDQGRYYNKFCPAVPPNYNGPNKSGRCYTGCVATSFAQIMYYFASRKKSNGEIIGLPEKGKGSVVYNYGEEVTVDLSEGVYDWENMLDRLTLVSPDESKDAIAKLIFHCGITTYMNYGPDASGTQSYFIVEGVKAATTNFDYREGGRNINRWDITSNEEWKYLLKNELYLNRPVHYSGSNDTVGHAFVCDGYSGGDFFHFNWGWSGYLDGYFFVDLISNSLSLIYNKNEAILVNLAPKSSEFPYCKNSTDNVITFRQGILDDGSGPNKCFANTNCNWLFSYSNEDTTLNEFDSLKFTFNNFRILPEDELAFYDVSGTTTLIAKFNGGDEIPEDIRTTSKEVMITFNTGSQQGEGWEIAFEVIVKSDVSIEENSLSNVSIFPNPANDNISFKGLEGKNTISIFDISGKQLMSVDKFDNGSIDISSLSNGVYFVNINNDKDIKTMKIIKQ
jgi:hypothetical protein